MTSKKQYGYTLIELLIVITLIAILATLGTSSYSRLQLQLTQRAVSTQVETALNHARQTAISSKKDVYVVIRDDLQCIGVSFDTSCDCSARSNCNINEARLNVSLSDSKVTLSNVRLARDKHIKFDGRLGLAAGNNGSFGLSTVIAEVRVIVSALGRSRLCIADGHLSGIRQC
jgi:prepilin-type N-terminal cleavage/methylation domain-containing protein